MQVQKNRKDVGTSAFGLFDVATVGFLEEDEPAMLKSCLFDGGFLFSC